MFLGNPIDLPLGSGIRFWRPQRHPRPGHLVVGETGIDEPGFYKEKLYADYVEKVKQLKKSGQLEEAKFLLMDLINATIAEARAQNTGVAPWHFEQMAIILRKQGILRRRWRCWSCSQASAMPRETRCSRSRE